ncbi:MAG: hypothetical protein ING59_09475 [Burkholderiales bacterium]|nr:hypothetical protein [Burkholderiales bacterium]
MSDTQRLAILRLPLSEKQIQLVLEETGASVSEALVAGYVDSATILENELVGDDARKIAEEIWTKNQSFVTNLNRDSGARGAFEEHCGHVIDAKVPNFAILR